MASNSGARPSSATRIQLHRYEHATLAPVHDWVASEEPLEIRLLHHTPSGLQRLPISVTMRTPGHDFELAAGFLFGESILRSDADLDTMAYCVEDGQEQLYNIVQVQLKPGVPFDPERLTRHFYTTSSCGVCGKASLESLTVQGCAAVPPGPTVSAELIGQLPRALLEDQRLFEQTGGLHAAGLFSTEGKLLCLREDVGRHNAVDKVVGHLVLNQNLGDPHRILMLSGRASFELMQKALRAQIPIVASVGAPSSLAVEVAREFGLTLMGFVSETRFNVYSGAQRLQPTIQT